jgi:hypothetical protein
MNTNLIQRVKELTGACLRSWRQAALLTLIAGFTAPAMGQPLQLVSVRDPSQRPPTGGSGDSGTPIVSPDGRYMLFASTANNLLLITNDTPIPAMFPAPLNVFLRDRTNGTTTLVSVNLSGTAGGNGDSLPMGLSTNGQYAVFESSASNLVAGDTNNATDVFVRDLVSGTTLLVSVSTNGQVGNGASRSPAMTPDGRYVAFVSAANNLVAGDTNGIPDVFVRDMQDNVTTLVSVGALSTITIHLAAGSEAPDISPDGRYVAFYSSATNLVPGVPAGGDVYVRDLAAGTTFWVSSAARDAVQATWGQTNASILLKNPLLGWTSACSTSLAGRPDAAHRWPSGALEAEWESFGKEEANFSGKVGVFQQNLPRLLITRSAPMVCSSRTKPACMARLPGSSSVTTYQAA